MANYIIDVQMSLPSAVATPIVTGNRRLTFLNLARLLWGSIAGKISGLSGASAYLQVQPTLVAATGTITAATVVNGNTASIGGTALTATKRRASGTVTCATAIAGNTITVNGQVFTGVAGAVVLGEATFSIDTGNNQTAASIVAQVNAYGGAKVAGIVSAKASAAVVTLYADEQGTSGNAITLASSGATLAVSGALFTGGTAIANNTFDFTGTNDETAAALAAAINASTTAAVQQVTATSSAAVVTVRSKVAGLAGNTIALASSGATLAVSAATLTSGSAGAVTRFSL